MGRIERSREIARSRVRKVKVKKLRALFASAKTEDEKNAVRAKMARVSPLVVLE
ncbi:DUF6800 family protein [Planctomicrobium sp. SH668]|uniref:DUF6800 family protein n=1 Tax=Planctomicrobium sp. SH668 TaxID=3448126 RepID=UPI003F5B1019